jgi:hypothetical protein
VSFNAYVDPLYEFQVIYQALTWQLTRDDTLLLLNDQSGLVLGDSTVFFWAGCHSWYQSDYMHQSSVNNLNHWFLNKNCQDCLDFQNMLVR